MRKSKKEKVKELIALFEQNATDVRESFNSWEEEQRNKFCDALGEKIHKCKGLSAALGGLPIAPDLKPIVEFALASVPEAHLEAIKEAHNIQLQLAAIRFRSFDKKALQLAMAVNGFCAWAGHGMSRPQFPMAAVALDEASKAGIDIYGEEFAELAPAAAPPSPYS